jgi:hypothetical protein
MRRCYDLNGLCLDVDAPSPELMAPIEQYVAPFASCRTRAGAYSISIGHGPLDDPPDGAQILAEGSAAGGVPSKLAVDGARSWFTMTGRFSVTSDRSARIVRVHLDRACDPASARLAGICAIDAALAASGQHLVHGAALALSSDTPRALLMFGPSGIGKTTAALALALGGFRLITDDAIVLQPPRNRLDAYRAWGLPRPLKVHRRTAELLPAIAPLMTADWDNEGEQPLQMAALQGLTPVLPPAPIAIAAVAVLGPRSLGEHRISPLGKASALAALAQDNIRRFARGILPDHVERFKVLGGMVATTPTFELRVGASLESLPQAVLEGLSQAPAQHDLARS